MCGSDFCLEVGCTSSKVQRLVAEKTFGRCVVPCTPAKGKASPIFSFCAGAFTVEKHEPLEIFHPPRPRIW